MKKHLNILLVIAIIFFVSCSTRKDNFTSRSYHNITSKYNVLYNGNLALDKGILELKDKYEDNYWEILPIEPMKIRDEFILNEKGENSNKTSFDIAEEKAVKTVQKHGMYIGGKEKNKQVDDAYLLLGKARYYSQRFVPSLEAFEFILKNNPKSELNNELRIWKAKTQIRLQNEEIALSNLLLLLNKKDIKKQEKENTHVAIAMAYFAMDSLALVQKHLLKAVVTDEDAEQHSRNLFILGQLYNLQQKADSSLWAFNSVINYKKSPHKYKVQAYLEKVKNTKKGAELDQLQEKITKLTKDPQNKKYLGEIYYQLAEIHFIKDNDSLALSELKKSVHFPTTKNFQKVLSYERIGDYYFDKTKFVAAGSYYDSVMPFVENSNTKHIRKLQRKIKNLEDIVFYENKIVYNDSILKLVHMSELERNNYFEEYIAKLKKTNELLAIKKENAERDKIAGNANSKQLAQTNNSGKWYFYNNQIVSFGKEEFQRVWGKRELKDNWRWSGKNIPNSNIDVSKDITRKSNTENKNQIEKYDVLTYINSIPTDGELIQKMHADNSNALYQLGLIYKEKFQVYTLAKERLERFLAENPKETLILPAKFHLVKIYEKLGDAKFSSAKADLVSNYPNSKYVQLLENTMENLSKDSIQTPEMHYEKVYCDYEYNKYDIVVSQCEKAIVLYAEDPILPKFELLKAYAIFHTKGKSQFMEGLEYVVINFPKTEEAIHAQEVLDRLNGIVRPKEEKKELPKQIENKNPIQIEKNKTQSKELNEEEKKQKVLDLINKNGPPQLDGAKLERKK